jgi:hypothetical protein
MPEINEYQLRITGKLNLPIKLEIDKTYDFTCKGLDIVGSSDNSNNNGSVNRCFKGVISEMSEMVIVGGKEIIRASKKKSASQRLRGRAFIWCEENDMTSPEDFYQLITNKIINNFDFIVEILRDK